MRFKNGFIIVILIIISSYSCQHRGNRGIGEGEIYFSIEYGGPIRGIKKEIMPKQMVVSFKDDKILFDMTSSIGKSGIEILSNPGDDIYDMYCSILSAKYYYAAKSGEMYPGFGAMKGMKVKETSKVAVICGYECHCAEVTIPSNSNIVYEVWYTNDINVDEPNRATPFEDIDGVVLRFFYIIGDLEIHFNAENVYSKKVDDLIFARKRDYVLVTKESIDQFIVKMINY